ncbi:MAG: hypothetical protein PHQ23_13375, partial [Candidatus Wallbacteria bacterium]|nr:hypothetical protein [Candidatus Wallbacteria bacterium]
MGQTIGILSDARGDVKSLRLVLDTLRQRGAEKVYSLGNCIDFDIARQSPAAAIEAVELIFEYGVRCLQADQELMFKQPLDGTCSDSEILKRVTGRLLNLPEKQDIQHGYIRHDLIASYKNRHLTVEDFARKGRIGLLGPSVEKLAGLAFTRVTDWFIAVGGGSRPSLCTVGEKLEEFDQSVKQELMP